MYPLLGGLLLILCAGCATTGTAALKDLPDDWPPLGTTKQDVHTRLGQPSTHSMSVESGQQQEMWIYNYEQSETNPLLFVVAAIAVAATGLERSGEAKELVLTFDQDGKVISRSMSTQQIGTSPAGPTDQYVR